MTRLEAKVSMAMLTTLGCIGINTAKILHRGKTEWEIWCCTPERKTEKAKSLHFHTLNEVEIYRDKTLVGWWGNGLLKKMEE